MQEVRLDNKASNADIIRNPATANAPVDTVNVAKIVFQEKTFDFGEVEEGTIVKHTFDFVNTGKVALLVAEVKSSCGCTIPEFNKQLIAPGQGDVIKVQFDTKNKERDQIKAVKVFANTYPAETILTIKGFVKSSVKK